MLLTITTTRYPATDLGYLLHKHPAKLHTFPLTAGEVHVFYPEATEERCTAALLLDLDPVRLTRKSAAGGNDFALEQYVNDRPYVASSFMSAALSQAYSSAMNARCKDKPELVELPLPLEVNLSVLPVNGGETLLRTLFEPLGYEVSVQSFPLDTQYQEWGQSRYYQVALKNTLPLWMLLSQLYVLIPVCDNDKHYFIGNHEIEKLMEKGRGWLDNHPAKELIVRRYMKHLGPLTRQALGLIMREEAEPEVNDEIPVPVEKIRLHDLRLQTVRDLLLEHQVTSVADLGCGEGKLLRLLMNKPVFTRILGMDVSYRALEIARDKLKLERLSERQQQRLTLIQGSLLYKDKRLSGFEAATLVEVIEHLDPPRLAILEKVVFEYARPSMVIVTTVNAEFNIKYESLTPGAFRHNDHRFEWTRPEFEAWATTIADRFGYTVTFRPLGEWDDAVGAPSQLALFIIAAA
ncbi:3' terminal RNA ribose 2'-O-methyltransferase Hen1 [Chitinophaga qingshengii]|uniref:Small RNA 2'-O-methyltransferase n=1 Tax=Chitinophaga qingshengii TaxID=1569794 RepID=A0ABR7TTB4_9BACT|nr:3' terminal RNA ribose 2'-O-methyltransferase Hen1 [Chitinophaga qingshengii]MBC9933285.1 3' terminal RNA ribose 2'-O-methyltransferase Hen1 [Chitinophaga qingshengii]